MYNITGQIIGSALGTALAYVLHFVTIEAYAQTRFVWGRILNGVNTQDEDAEGDGILKDRRGISGVWLTKSWWKDEDRRTRHLDDGLKSFTSGNGTLSNKKMTCHSGSAPKFGFG